ncbi:MAG: phosphatidylserine decarboxylase [Candidatus Hodarchaeales archaeon]|jgi:phosphatidylserine decarboxylase
MRFILPLAKGHQLMTIPSLVLVILSIFWVYLYRLNDWYIIVLALILLIFVIQFFRDPTRIPESSDTTMIVSPADGVVFEIDNNTKPGITIFRIRMRFWDVHVNRMPITGTLESIEKKTGSIWPLPILPKLNKYSKNRNARKILKFSTVPGLINFSVVQISGTLAYRTVPYGKPKAHFERGERIGMIRFGSETDFMISTNVIEVLTHIGKKVKAGQTVIARLISN